MTRPADRRIVRLARKLGLPTERHSREGVREYALQRLERILASTPFEADSPKELKQTAAAELDIQLEHLESDEDMGRLADQYGAGYPNLGRLLREEFIDTDTEGLLLRRPIADERFRRYLSIVDARGRKRYRADFTDWHEIGHVLISPEKSTFKEVRRTPPREARLQDPIESLVDSIAGDLAFYDPLFCPVLEEVVDNGGGLSVEVIDRTRRRYKANASFYGVARAAVLASDRPACFVRAELRLKKAERRRLNSNQGELDLGAANEPPDPDLRLVDFWANDAVKESPLELHENIRVPERSVLHEVHDHSGAQTRARVENQAWWETSKKGRYPDLPIRVEATRRGKWVYGLITIAAQ